MILIKMLIKYLNLNLKLYNIVVTKSLVIYFFYFKYKIITVPYVTIVL